MKSNFEQIRDEMVEMINNERAENKKRADEETQIRADYEAAQKEMSAALESGSMDRYKAAGMKAEEKRLELEFIGKRKARVPEPVATPDEENRFRNALYGEYMRIRDDAIAQLKKLYEETQDVAAEAAQRLAKIDNIFTSFENVVMKKNGTHYVTTGDIRLMFAQKMNAAKAETISFQHIK